MNLTEIQFNRKKFEIICNAADKLNELDQINILGAFEGSLSRRLYAITKHFEVMQEQLYSDLVKAEANILKRR